MQSNNATHPVSDRHASHDVGVLATTQQKNQASLGFGRDFFIGRVYDSEMCLDMWDPESAQIVMESIGRWLGKCRRMGTYASHDVVWDLYVDGYVVLFLIS
jgi:hypothetical protein